MSGTYHTGRHVSFRVRSSRTYTYRSSICVPTLTHTCCYVFIPLHLLALHRNGVQSSLSALSYHWVASHRLPPTITTSVWQCTCSAHLSTSVCLHLGTCLHRHLPCSHQMIALRLFYLAHAIYGARHCSNVFVSSRSVCVCLYYQAFAWSSDSIARARELFGDAPFVGRSLTMSSAYSGIATVEQSSHQVCHNLSSTLGCGSHSLQSLWTLEKDDVCKAELASYFSDLGSDSCVYGNLIALVPESWWADLGVGPNAKELTPTELYAKRLHRTKLILEGHTCAAHVGCHTCKLGHSDVHVAGTTCVDHSSYGSCTGNKHASKQAIKQSRT